MLFRSNASPYYLLKYFIQYGDMFEVHAGINNTFDLTHTGSASATDVVLLGVPGDVAVVAKLNAILSGDAAAGHAVITRTTYDDYSDTGFASLYHLFAAHHLLECNQMFVATAVSGTPSVAKVRCRISNSGNALYAKVAGYIDRRGQG